MKRKNFLKSIIGSSLFLGSPLSNMSLNTDSLEEVINKTKKDVDGSMFGFSAPPIKKVKVGIIGLGNRGSVLLEMFQFLIKNNLVEILGLCDIEEKKVINAKEKLSKWQTKVPNLYYKTKSDWKNLVKNENIDLIIIATPWNLHSPMAIFSMKKGKHVACEVPISSTIEDCWKIITTSEKTKKHCIMLENCNYNEEELWVLNMVEEGGFGNISHTEGAYMHDLRALMLNDSYYQ